MIILPALFRQCLTSEFICSFHLTRPPQARPDDNEIAWQYWRFLREKLKQPGRAVDLAARAQEHQAMLSALTRQPVRWSSTCAVINHVSERLTHRNPFAVCCGQNSKSEGKREREAPRCKEWKW